jgi:DNA-binding protein HU-beta
MAKESNAGTNTSHLEALVAEDLKVTKKEAKVIIKSIVTCVATLVKQSNRLQIVDFGVVSVKTVRPRTGRNPKTGESLQIPETKTAAFKPARSFKDFIRG